MKKISLINAKDIYFRELEYLKDGISNSKNPYHFLYLSTLNNDYPQSRTVVLRGFKNKPNKILFNADFRSPKVKQLIENSNCLALFYDNDRKVQLRFNCRAIINHKNSLSYKVWSKTPLQSRKCYMGDLEPSKVINNWDPNIPIEYLKKDPEQKNSELGYENFTVIELIVNNLDLLELHHDGHIRFNIHNDKITFLAP
tara:strand:- start:181 stop:774 length:594 start_codon:yes stop_codon:yes gene_type:complete